MKGYLLPPPFHYQFSYARVLLSAEGRWRRRDGLQPCPRSIACLFVEHNEEAARKVLKISEANKIQLTESNCVMIEEVHRRWEGSGAS
jgi:hypothetical protein